MGKKKESYGVTLRQYAVAPEGADVEWLPSADVEANRKPRGMWTGFAGVHAGRQILRGYELAGPNEVVHLFEVTTERDPFIGYRAPGLKDLPEARVLQIYPGRIRREVFDAIWDIVRPRGFPSKAATQEIIEVLAEDADRIARLKADPRFAHIHAFVWPSIVDGKPCGLGAITGPDVPVRITAPGYDGATPKLRFRK